MNRVRSGSIHVAFFFFFAFSVLFFFFFYSCRLADSFRVHTFQFGVNF